MSMTRHLVNRRRRLASRTDTAPPPRQEDPKKPRRPEPDRNDKKDRDKKDRDDKARAKAQRAERKRERKAAGERTGRSRLLLPAILGLVAVLLGGYALWASAKADSLKDDPALRNTALSDTAATSEVIGTVSDAINSLFSYDYASPEDTDAAAEEWLTGEAVEQHETLLAPVREVGEEERMVLTTTVTHAGVEILEGDRARLLIYADQTSARADDESETLHGPAVLTVEAVHRDGTWLIAGIDTYGG
ncbi:hypothetical protein [Streptomyces specialis]|uniref:hypothetical protein n=1 Tax=Streptomyces specialis TaxID=498367 RepID=UPI00073E2162|nr:hypothetical protein [Streptomyces specialis]